MAWKFDVDYSMLFFQWLSWQAEHERPPLYAQFLKYITLVLSETTAGLGTMAWLVWPQFCKYIVPVGSMILVETCVSLQPQCPQFCMYITLALSDASAETGIAPAAKAASRQLIVAAKRTSNICNLMYLAYYRNDPNLFYLLCCLVANHALKLIDFVSMVRVNGEPSPFGHSVC